MKTEVSEGLWVGSQAECPWTRPVPYGAVLHGVKDPCHKIAVDYRGARSLRADHPEYLWADRGLHLALNLVDPPVPLFKVASFVKAMDWLDEWQPKGPVLIHCNQGTSRAPSIALVWLAKRAKRISGESFEAARREFLQRFPGYAPGLGIETFLTERWAEIA